MNVQWFGNREWSKHPFVMPLDEKVFHIRALQKKKERLDFKRDCERSVVDKSTFASRSGAIVGSERLKKVNTFPYLINNIIFCIIFLKNYYYYYLQI
jgi:hypothetical protein